MDLLDGFDLIQTPYKTVGNHEIRADFLIPKSSFTGKRPVIVRFHGGGLIGGDSLIMGWFPRWLLALAKKHHAVIASANYRLMPESTSPEIFQDIEDFWTWLHSSTAAEILSPTTVDLTRVITAGESAGGLLSISLALAHPDEIRAATASYPMVDVAAPHFRTSKPALLQQPQPESLVADHEGRIQPGDICSSGGSEERINLMLAVLQYGDLNRFYERGTEGFPRDARYPLERLDRSGVRMPPGGMAILHGRQDTVVPLDGVQRFVDKAREVLGDGIRLTVRDGIHGFDLETPLEEWWLSDHLKGVIEGWFI
ncbi:hypothetical protein EYZ11_003865 [Aspergillus tanneri]|uniref:Alpha/beta hydrolase fold-3 domain-containing protein n=1 Tax=Aspergillus tanneri TaxID=1220188 RepID=A0A4S3JMK8_9EURO|nr:uncharacterized protein ATNIH1004_005850 [Aspergillus tanneri]KAA8647162.1 hypothetical protein ATNIH1004_005850 [Aspergillus tanneri]THC96660.1 hypothetical protein EYZ11_003865 [Aspergillus tanneri]